MTNRKVNPVELARAGDCKAIDYLINQQLSSKGITARSVFQDGHLQIILESETTPNQEKLIPFIYKGIKGLESDVFSSLEICGRGKYSSEIVWGKRFSLKTSEAKKEQSDLVEIPQKSSSEIKENNISPIELKGTNGTLIIENDKIRIIRQGGFLGTHKKSARDIPYSEILSFQYAPPKGFTSEGFFYFQVGNNVPEITRKESLLDENSVQFANLNELQTESLSKINDILLQKIGSSKDEGIFFLGDNGSLTLKDSFVSIHRNSRNLGATSVGNKNIPYRSITAVQFHKSEKIFLGYTKGFLQLTIHGGREMQGGIASAMFDENTVTFETEEKNIEFAKAKEIIETRVQQPHNSASLPKSASSLDDLEKLAALKEKGIITEEEFQAKKKQILGL